MKAAMEFIGKSPIIIVILRITTGQKSLERYNSVLVYNDKSQNLSDDRSPSGRWISVESWNRIGVLESLYPYEIKHRAPQF